MSIRSVEVEVLKGLSYKVRPLVPVITEVADQKVVAVEIKGDPSKETERISGPLYAAAYGIRKEYKDEGHPFVVDKLRGRWPSRNMSLPRSQWTGIYALPVPNDVKALPPLKPEKQVPGVSVSLTTWRYGLVAQILHVGPYSTEWPTIEKLHAFVESKGYEVLPDSHEEIYLSDPRRTAPEEMKTLLLCRLKG
jgi:hypothetical protein